MGSKGVSSSSGQRPGAMIWTFGMTSPRGWREDEAWEMVPPWLPEAPQSAVAPLPLPLLPPCVPIPLGSEVDLCVREIDERKSGPIMESSTGGGTGEEEGRGSEA